MPAATQSAGLRAAIHGVFLDRLRYGSIRSSRDGDPDATLMAICERHGVNPADRREVLSFFQALINLL
ncbi:MAG: hypothetical protein VKM34_06460 [Cyanobacteriota bacterium]|nr:hypothetical protein [Cyanobacteriota bacterium]